MAWGLRPQREEKLKKLEGGVWCFQEGLWNEVFFFVDCDVIVINEFLCFVWRGFVGFSLQRLLASTCHHL